MNDIFVRGHIAGVRETAERRGLFLSFHSDRGSHYWNTPAAGGKVDRSNPTQFGRAMGEQGIGMIPYDPVLLAADAGSLGAALRHDPGRLWNKLALEGVRDMEAANDYLRGGSRASLPEPPKYVDTNAKRGATTASGSAALGLRQCRGPSASGVRAFIAAQPGRLREAWRRAVRAKADRIRKRHGETGQMTC